MLLLLTSLCGQFALLMFSAGCASTSEKHTEHLPKEITAGTVMRETYQDVMSVERQISTNLLELIEASDYTSFLREACKESNMNVADMPDNQKDILMFLARYLRAREEVEREVRRLFEAERKVIKDYEATLGSGYYKPFLSAPSTNAPARQP